MEFDFIQWESDMGTQYVPALPVLLNGFPVGHILVDTGATVTLLPMTLHEVLGVGVDKANAITMLGAGGERFKAFPSLSKIEYRLEKGGFRPIEWRGTAFFTHCEGGIILGHHQCLDQLVLTFDGPRKKLKVEKR